MTIQYKQRRDALRRQICQALTSQERDGAGAIELSRILDHAAGAITEALLPRNAKGSVLQSTVVFDARLLARGLAILAETLAADQSALEDQIARLAIDLAKEGKE